MPHRNGRGLRRCQLETTFRTDGDSKHIHPRLNGIHKGFDFQRQNFWMDQLLRFPSHFLFLSAMVARGKSSSEEPTRMGADWALLFPRSNTSGSAGTLQYLTFKEKVARVHCKEGVLSERVRAET